MGGKNGGGGFRGVGVRERERERERERLKRGSSRRLVRYRFQPAFLACRAEEHSAVCNDMERAASVEHSVQRVERLSWFWQRKRRTAWCFLAIAATAFLVQREVGCSSLAVHRGQSEACRNTMCEVWSDVVHLPSELPSMQPQQRLAFRPFFAAPKDSAEPWDRCIQTAKAVRSWDHTGPLSPPSKGVQQAASPPTMPASVSAPPPTAATAATTSNGESLSHLTMQQLREEAASLQQLRKQLVDAKLTSNLSELDNKMAAVEREQQGRNPGQSLDSALAKQRKATTARDRAEAHLKKMQQAVVEATEQLQAADQALQSAIAHVEEVRKTVAPEPPMAKPPSPPPCTQVAVAVAQKLSHALAHATAQHAQLTDSQVAELVAEELQPIWPVVPKGVKRTAETTPQEPKAKAGATEPAPAAAEGDASMSDESADGSQSVLQPGYPATFPDSTQPASAQVPSPQE